MVRKVRVRLDRKPPGKRRTKGHRRQRSKWVVVQSLSVGAFMALAEAWMGKFHAIGAMLRKAPEPIDLLKHATPKDVALVAALACPEESPDFYLPFVSPKNNWRMLEAMGLANDWGKILGILNTDPRKRPGRSSIQENVFALCQLYPGTTPPTIYSWPMEDFIDAVHASVPPREYDHTTDPDSEPTMSLDELNALGAGMVH